MLLNVETALQIAERDILMRIQQSPIFSRHRFGPVILKSDNDRFYVFVSGSEELYEAGHVPGALYACVDKTDGHLWTREEQELYYAKVSHQAQPESIAA